MKFKYIDGQDGDDKNLNEFARCQIEALQKCKNILKEANLNFFIVSLDSKGDGGGIFNLPEDNLTAFGMIINLDDQLKYAYKDFVRVIVANDGDYHMVPDIAPKLLKKFTDEKEL